jgi:hypothetical protein
MATKATNQLSAAKTPHKAGGAKPKHQYEPRPPAPTTRQLRSTEYEKQWKRELALQAEARRKQGWPKLKQPNPAHIRSTDVLRALEYFYQCTGDKRFHEACQAMLQHKLDREPKRTAQALREPFFTDQILSQVAFLVNVGVLKSKSENALERAAAAVARHPEKSDHAIAAEIGVSNQIVKRARRQIGRLKGRRKLSEREASERVVAEYGIPGPSFGSLVNALRRAFAKHNLASKWYQRKSKHSGE